MRVLFSVSILGDPVPKGRPRSAGGKVYTPPRTRRWEAAAAQIIALQWGAAELVRPVGLSVVACHRRPKNRPKSIAPELWALGSELYRPSKPDLDNIIKAVKDSIEKGGVVANDSQICELRARKVIAAKGAEPCVIIHVYEIGEVP